MSLLLGPIRMMRSLQFAFFHTQQIQKWRGCVSPCLSFGTALKKRFSRELP
jgi:hypothetical protein